jgi:ubiquinone/menaquinone biosynthesis C-methylase UbiE
MNEEQKTIIKETFNTIAAGYDTDPLRFFPASAAHLARLLALRGDERVLDVACGTGHATLAIAPLLPRGTVTAVDFSAGMLARAQEKAAARGLANIEFLERDMQQLGLPEQSYDLAVCAFGIFFVEEMEGQLAHMATMVKPGGRVVITNFQESYFHPLKELFIARLQAYGVETPPQPWRRIAHADGCRRLFEQAGLADIRVEDKDVGYYLADAEEWWEIVWNAGYRRLVNRLSAPEQARFKEEHLREVAALRIAQGIRLDVGVLFSSGMVPRS